VSVLIMWFFLSAEIHHFHRERCRDFKDVMKKYLGEQVKFHQEVSSNTFKIFLYDFKQCFMTAGYLRPRKVDFELCVTPGSVNAARSLF